jgi:hypothetical protein
LFELPTPCESRDTLFRASDHSSFGIDHLKGLQLLPDETVISASKSFIDVGVVGTVALLAIVALYLITKKLFSVQDQLLAAVESHKNDAVKWAGMTEILKNQMEDQADLMKATIEIVRERGKA